MIESIEIKNYRSLGDSNNILKIDKNITTLVGKNESGKSNILNAIKDIKFFSKQLVSLKIFTQKNRILPKEIEISFKVWVLGSDLNDYIPELEFKPDEKYAININITKKNGVIQQTFDGIFSELISNNSELQILREKYIEIAKTINDSETLIKEVKKDIERCQQDHSIYFPGSQITALLQKNQNNNNERKYSSCKDAYTRYKLLLDNYYATFNEVLTNIFYYQDLELKDSYSLEEFKKISKDHILSKLLYLAGIEDTEIINYFEQSDMPLKHDHKKDLDELFLNNLTKDFNDLYQQEEVQISIDFDQNNIYLYFITDGKSSPFSERSEGFQWYFKFFIQLRYSGFMNTRNLILIDEPATNLHVEAQKEILDILEEISKDYNQIIFSTHSPYMININNIKQVRLVEKIDGITKIQNNYYHSESTGKSKMETLTPIINALGCSLKYNLGPQYEQLNVIVEGITDFYYLEAMWKKMNLPEEEKPYFLPCAGVENVDKVLTIIYGWGYDYMLILDNDPAGRKEYKKIKKILLEKADEYVVFIKECNEDPKPAISRCKCKYMIEDLLSDNDKDKLESEDKTFRAKEFHEKINELELEKETLNNFRNLFERLNLIAPQKSSEVAS